ncbi:MAG: hypothetical protein GWO24_23915, partial [Akkermansiaceae bacterium]|nr:hypothetical protein [Akkermansiaceae bacterium]
GGVTVFDNYDVVAEAGGPLRAVAAEFKGIAASGSAGMRIEVINQTSHAGVLSAIEVTVANTGGVPAPTFDVDVSVDGGTTWAPVAGAVGVDRFGRGSTTWIPTVETAGATGLMRVRANDGSLPEDISDAGFSVSNAGTDYYVNDLVQTGDIFTTAVGNNFNTGKSPDQPMASLFALFSAYLVESGDTVHIDTGNYEL